MEIRRAREEEAAALSGAARLSKAHWPYAAEQIEAWLPDLTVTAEQIAAHPTCVAEHAADVVGFYHRLEHDDSAMLEHLWVLPQHMGNGYGRALLAHAVALARRAGSRAAADAHFPSGVGRDESRHRSPVPCQNASGRFMAR